MIFKTFEISAMPVFQKVRCPKHQNDMLEISNGWFSVCWYCKECDAPYELKISKMRQFSRENLIESIKKRKTT